MHKGYAAWFLLLLPALLLSLACNLGVVRKWVKGPAGPTSAPATAVPVPAETASAPALTATPVVPEATPTAQVIPPPTSPPPPDEVYVGEVELDMAALEQLQAATDQGHQPWRLDPLEVTRNEGVGLGFDPAQDTFELLPVPDPATGEAQVLVLRSEGFYVIHLVQPMRVGPDGLWAIARVEQGL